MKNLLLVIMLFAFGFASGQYNQTDSQGRKTGKWKKVYSNGKTRYEGQFDKGMPYGTFTYYNTNGQITTILKYSKDGHYAECKMYYVKGQLRATGYYHDRKKDSTWLYYSLETQNVVAEENYKDGVKNGVWRIFYNNGQLSSEVFWVNGKKHGTWKEFFPDGTKRLETKYVNDRLDGDYKLYNLNGQVIKQGKYVNGKRDGIWVIFDDRGQKKKVEYINDGWVEKEEFYKNGVLEKTEIHSLKAQPKKK